MDDDDDRKNRGKFIIFFSNPVVGIVGSLASVFGLVIAVYFFTLSHRYRDLVYYIDPAKAVVVKTGQTSRLRVLIGDKELSSDVTAAQIAIWNQGKEPIHARDILEKITIRTVPAVPILEASIRKLSRNIIGISLDQAFCQDGALTVSWNILEKEDGGVIQIVYAGGPETEIEASGVIEGQAKIRKLQYSKLQPAAKGSKLLLIFFWSYLIFGILSFVYGIYRIKRRRLAGRDVPMFLIVGYIIAPVCVIGISVFVIIWRGVQGPPFGF